MSINEEGGVCLNSLFEISMFFFIILFCITSISVNIYVVNIELQHWSHSIVVF